jgi:hypothetical protein
MKDFYSQLPGLKWEKDNSTESGTIRSVWYRMNHSPIILMLEKENYSKSAHALVFSASDTQMTSRELEALPLNWNGSSVYTVYFLDPDGNRLGYSTYPTPWNEY